MIKIRKKIFGFLWNKKNDKIKRDGLNQDYSKSGLNMIDVDLMVKALRLT